MRLSSLLSVSSTVLLVAAASPAEVEAQEELWCVLECWQSIPSGQHLALQVGDLDDWDGGYHEETPFPGDCCWYSPGAGCRHESCRLTEEDQDDLEAATDAVDQALERSDMDAVAGAFLRTRSLRLNARRSSIQVVTRCPEREEAVALANIPVTSRQLDLLVGSVPKGQILDSP